MPNIVSLYELNLEINSDICYNNIQNKKYIWSNVLSYIHVGPKVGIRCTVYSMV